jgi:hypothetical protein
VVVVVAATEAEVVVATSEVVIAAAVVVGTRMGTPETTELSKLLRPTETPRALLEVDVVVVAAAATAVVGVASVVVGVVVAAAAATAVVGVATVVVDVVAAAAAANVVVGVASVVVDVVVAAAAVDPPVPENDTPDVTLESEVVVGAGGGVVLELVVKTPPGPNVIPPSVDAAAKDVVSTAALVSVPPSVDAAEDATAKDVVSTAALVSVADAVGSTTTDGNSPVDPTIESRLLVVGLLDVGVEAGGIGTTVVC